MQTYRTIIAGSLITLLIGAVRLAAQEPAPADLMKQMQRRIEELEEKVRALEAGRPAAPETNAPQQIQQLDQKIRILERNRELELEAAEARAKETPKITLGDKGFSLESAGGNFGVQLKGVLQVDSRTFFEDAGTAGNDGILLRRARPILQGTVFRDFDFQFVPDFGGTGSPQIYDAWVNYRYRPELQLQAGKFKTPVGLEQLLADRDVWFNERGLPTDLVPNRDLGIELHGELFEGLASYAAGVFNGVGDARNSGNADIEDDKSFAGRLFLQPGKNAGMRWLEGFGFGVGGSYEHLQSTNTAGLPGTTGGSLPGYATTGQQQFFAYNPANRAVVLAEGDHWRLSPQASYTFGPFGLLAEYAISNQKVTRTGTAPQPSARLEHMGWQLAGSWLLTGEDAILGTVVPRRPFDPRKGSWGALQVVARYSELDIDSAVFPLFADPRTSARGAQEWSLGLNWYLNRNLKVSSSFSHTTFEGAGRSASSVPGKVTRKPENVLFTRVQVAF